MQVRVSRKCYLHLDHNIKQYVQHIVFCATESTFVSIIPWLQRRENKSGCVMDRARVHKGIDEEEGISMLSCILHLIGVPCSPLMPLSAMQY